MGKKNLHRKQRLRQKQQEEALIRAVEKALEEKIPVVTTVPAGSLQQAKMWMTQQDWDDILKFSRG